MLASCWLILMLGVGRTSMCERTVFSLCAFCAFLPGCVVRRRAFLVRVFCFLCIALGCVRACACVLGSMLMYVDASMLMLVRFGFDVDVGWC
jgi:hypothetical protein